MNTSSKAKLVDDLAAHLNQMVDHYFSPAAPLPPQIDIKEWLNPKNYQQAHFFEAGNESYLPPYADWEKLSRGIQNTAKMMGIHKTGFGYASSNAKRIEHDYPRFRFARFKTMIEARFLQFPVPPLTRLFQIQQSTDNDHEKILCRELYLLLGGSEHHIRGRAYDLLPADQSLERYEPLLKALSGPSAIPVFQNGKTTTVVRHRALNALRNEQAQWNALFGQQFKNAAPHLYAYQDPSIDKALRRVLHGRALTSDQMRDVMNKINATKRQRRHRAAIKQSLPQKT